MPGNYPECIGQGLEVWTWSRRISFKEPATVPHEKNKPAFGLFQGERRHSVAKSDVQTELTKYSYFALFSVILPSFHPSLCRGVSSILEDRRGCRVRTNHSPLSEFRFLNVG